MEITGKIILVLPEVTGLSKSGNSWKKREYVLETQESYPRKVHFDFFGDKADQYILNLGDTVRLSFDIESREYNGRWYTSIRGWKAEKVDDNAPSYAPQAAPAVPTENIPPIPQAPISGDADDNLPF